VSWLFGGPGRRRRRGLREQDRAEMVKCIRLCLDRTGICAATLGW